MCSFFFFDKVCVAFNILKLVTQKYSFIFNLKWIKFFAGFFTVMLCKIINLNIKFYKVCIQIL